MVTHRHLAGKNDSVKVAGVSHRVNVFVELAYGLHLRWHIAEMRSLSELRIVSAVDVRTPRSAIYSRHQRDHNDSNTASRPAAAALSWLCWPRDDGTFVWSNRRRAFATTIESTRVPEIAAAGAVGTLARPIPNPRGAAAHCHRRTGASVNTRSFPAPRSNRQGTATLHVSTARPTSI